MWMGCGLRLDVASGNGGDVDVGDHDLRAARVAHEPRTDDRGRRPVWGSLQQRSSSTYLPSRARARTQWVSKRLRALRAVWARVLGHVHHLEPRRTAADRVRGRARSVGSFVSSPRMDRRRDLGACCVHLPWLEPAGRHTMWPVDPARASGRGEDRPLRRALRQVLRQRRCPGSPELHVAAQRRCGTANLRAARCTGRVVHK